MLASDEQARQATAVGNAITRLHREHYGRGATTTYESASATTLSFSETS